jgi:hypothetical protein
MVKVKRINAKEWSENKMLRNNTYGIEKEEQPMKNLGKG